MGVKSKIGTLAGSFRYVECLSESEALSDNGNPRYRAICTICGSERELAYRNRKPTCLVCKSGGYHAHQNDKTAQVQLVLIFPGQQCLVKRAENVHDLYGRLTSAEMRAQLLLIDADGSAKFVTAAELNGSLREFGGDSTLILADYLSAAKAAETAPESPPPLPAITPLVLQQVQQQEDARIALQDGPGEDDSLQGESLKAVAESLGRPVRQDDFPPD